MDYDINPKTSVEDIVFDMIMEGVKYRRFLINDTIINVQIVLDDRRKSIINRG